MKSLRSKLTLVLSFFAVIMIALGFVFMPKTVSAALDTSKGFYINNGAQIRFATDELGNPQNGIKWTANLTAEGYAGIKTEIQEKYSLENAVDMTEIGIAIVPVVAVGTENQEAHTNYKAYQGGIENVIAILESGNDFVYNWAVFYDNLKDAVGEDAAKLYGAYAMNLRAMPYMIINGETYIGEYYDTDRSVQGIALSHIVDKDYEGQVDKLDILNSYFNVNVEVDPTEYISADSFYSNYDETGAIAIDDRIAIEEDTKIYYGAKEVTDLYNSETGAVDLTGVQTKITTDGKVNDFLTIFHADGTVQKQYFVGVTLAIDDVSDMDYFKLKKQAYSITEKVGSGYNYYFQFADGDFEYDGYYVLLNDIDFNNVKFDIRNGLLSSSKTEINASGKFNLREADQIEKWASSYGLKKADGTLKGLTGTFDGRGYAFKRFVDNTTGSGEYSGLFGLILGGTVKNVGFIDCGSRRSSYTLASSVSHGATISNVYVKSSGKYYIGLNHSELAYQVSPTVTFDKILMEVSYSTDTSYDGGFDTTTRNYAQSGGAFTSRATDAKVTDYYQIGNTPMYRYKYGGDGAWITSADAKYIDGVENTVGSVIYTNAKRYTSIKKMEEDVAVNNFDAWDPDIWVIKNGVPYFKSTLSNAEYSAYLGNNEITGEEFPIIAGDSHDVTIKYGNDDVSVRPSLSIVSGDCVSVSGNVITATAKGNAVVKATYGKYSWNINLAVASVPIDYEIEYQFSAYDGLFFNGANVVDLDTILANLTGLGQVSAVTDGEGNSLTYDATEGTITGLDLGALDKEKGETWKSSSIILFGEENNYRLLFQAADLIIDDEYDFAYFTIQGDGSYNESSDTFTYNGDDFVWDGYYVMVKNINAYNYYHCPGPNASFKPRDVSLTAVAKTNYGLSGVFDGQGYCINKMVIRSFGKSGKDGKSGQDGAGLFSFINGGTVKNLKITNMYTHNTKQSGTNHVTNAMPYSVSNQLFATHLIGATLQDIHFDVYRSQASTHTLLFNKADANSTLTRIFINHTDAGINTNGSGFFNDCKATLNEVYVVSKMALYTQAISKQTDAFLTSKVEEGEEAVTTTLGHNWMLSKLDSATVDDVTRSYCRYIFGNGTASTMYNIDDYASFTTKATGGTTYSSSSPWDSKVLSGIKRYTSTAAMKANWANFEVGDANRNDFSNWSSTIWTISADGIPSMHAITK